MSQVSGQTQRDWFKRLDQNPQPVVRTLVCVIMALCAACIVLRAGFKLPLGPEVFGSLVFAGLTLGGLAWYSFGDRSSFNAGESARLLVLIVGGSLGFALALATLSRVAVWWDYVAGGLETWQGTEGWRLWLVMGMGVVSCVIMFGSLLLARTEEQTNPFLRRLLYGYVTWLTAFLLLIILLLLNLLVYNYLPNVADYTNNKIYTLNPKSQQILQALKKPVTVIALVDSIESVPTKELQNLDDNCRRVTDRIRFEYVVRDRNRALVQRLVEKYKIVSDLGLLVIYGDEDAPNTNTQFIKLDDLFSSSGSADSFGFKGEDVLIATVDFLDQDKTKPVLYFTQNNGEYDLGFASEQVPDKRPASVLRKRLEEANYEVKGLRLTNLPIGKGDQPAMVASAQVPDHAAAVIILSPTTRMGEDTIKALEAYMNPSDPKKKKGKLIVLLDVDVIRSEGTMRDTGLEPLLQSFGVEITKQRIVSYGPEAQRVLVIGNPEARATNPVAAALGNESVAMFDVRPMQNKPVAPNRPGASPYQVDNILIAMASNVAPWIWAEPNLTRDPNELVQEIKNDRKKAETKNLTRGGIPVAVAVSEAGQPDPNDPHAFMQAPPAGTPRLLAFGNASFVSDSFLQGRQGSPQAAAGYPNYDVFESSLAWLRERPSGIGPNAKDRKIYQIEPNTNLTRMEFLPLGLMVITILGLGLGVWVVRRR